MNLNSPAWSPDGQHIAFFQGPKRSRRGEVAILDAASGDIIYQVPMKYARGISLGHGYLRWSADGRRIFLWVTRSPVDEQTTTQFDKDVGVITLGSMDIRWLGQWVVTRTTPSQHGRWERQIETAEDAEAIKTLFGSSENGILQGYIQAPIWSPDRRYLFRNRYSAVDAEEWIERYDTETQEKATIKILWKYEYDE